MPGLSCNACNREFQDEAEQKLHYKSEWHRYNLKRKVAGVPGVTEPLFLARQSALAQEKNISNEAPMLYTCGLCNKGYRSSKAHSQHLQSRSHLVRAASQGTSDRNGESMIIKPLPTRVAPKLSQKREQYEEESEESDWEEVDPEDDLVSEAMDSISQLNMHNEHATGDNIDDSDGDGDDYGLDPSCCFMCDLEHDSIDSCMVHMHKKHGFFIPDVEYLKDPEGLLTYLGLKVKRDFLCLYCNDRCHPFYSLEAVRKHMSAKSHCKVHYGDGGEDEEGELEEFYDYSSSYVGEDGKQLVAASGESENTVELGTGGSELIITRRTDMGTSTKMLGSREYLRYYRQKPRPSPENNVAMSLALASRYQSMGLSTVQSKEHMVRIKVMKEMNRTGVEAMRSKMGMKSNVIRNLPKNVPY